MLSLEDELAKGIDQGTSLERALLIASGVQTEEEIEKYTRKLDALHAGFRKYVESLSRLDRLFVPKLKLISEFLWNRKINRYRKDKFLLPEAIDGQLSSNGDTVGNCLGLTALYTVLAMREGENPLIVSEPYHVKSGMKKGLMAYSVENTRRYGFSTHVSFSLRSKTNGIELLPSSGLIFSILTSRGASEEKSKNFDRAIDIFSRAIELKPNYTPILYNRAKMLKRLHKHEEARQDIERIVNCSNPNSIDYYYRALAKEEMQDFHGALIDYNKAIRTNPKIYDYWNGRGVIKFDLGEYIAAIEDFNAAARLSPRDSAVYVNLAAARAQINDLYGALMDIRKALKLNPKNGWAYFNRGVIRHSREKFSQALADFEVVRKISTDATLVSLAISSIGAVMQDIGELEKAINNFDLAIETDPENHRAYFNRAAMKLDSGELRGALSDYDLAIRNMPFNSGYYADRGLAKISLDDMEGARHDINKAIELNPKNSLAYFYRGQLRQMSGDLDFQSDIDFSGKALTFLQPR